MAKITWVVRAMQHRLRPPNLPRVPQTPLTRRYKPVPTVMYIGKTRLTADDILNLQIVNIEESRQRYIALGYGKSIAVPLSRLKQRGLVTWDRSASRTVRILGKPDRLTDFAGLRLTSKGFESLKKGSLKMGARIFLR